MHATQTDRAKASPRRDADASSRPSPWLAATLVAAIGIGVLLRFAWLEDTVFCNDQARACALAEDVAAGRWQTGGLVNSGGFRNHPAFVYLLAGAWAMASGPMPLLGAIVAANLAALGAAWWITRRWFGGAAALWATALLATAPWAIHYTQWIWAQHLLFPSALPVYLFLWLWIDRAKPWAATGVVLALTLAVQIHLAAIVLAVAAVGVVVLLRPKIALLPLAVGTAIALATTVPWLAGGHLASPEANRTGYQHVWRVVPGAMMSVSGAGWQLEFAGGYPAFRRSLSWRWYAYQAANLVSILLLLVAAVTAIAVVVARRGDPSARRRPLTLVTVLVAMIPLAFAAIGIRTSPTYLPVWYPLPMALMGWWLANRLGTRPGLRAGVRVAVLAAMALHVAFYAEQALFIRHHHGVPGSKLGRSLAGLRLDLALAPAACDAEEVWLVYRGPSGIQDEAAAYLLRRADWPAASPGGALVTVRLSGAEGPATVAVSRLGPDEPPPEDAWLVRPWTGAMQVGGKVPRRPEASLDGLEAR